MEALLLQLADLGTNEAEPKTTKVSVKLAHDPSLGGGPWFMQVDGDFVVSGESESADLSKVFLSADDFSAHGFGKGKLLITDKTSGESPTVAINSVFSATGKNFSTVNLTCPIILHFEIKTDSSKFLEELKAAKAPASHLDHMDKSVVQTYFQYYAKLSNQANMLQDSVRTSVYRRAFSSNPTDFKGKTVMDIGAGSGILSYFAVQSGASLVYAVEASNVCEMIHIIKDSNSNLNNVVPLNETLESIVAKNIVPKKSVDVLVSECIGIFLLNERMMETFLYARDNFLKEGGKLYPNKCRMSLAPFSDAALFADVSNRGAFWLNPDFHGVNLSACAPRAFDEQLRQPIVDYIDPTSLVAQPCTKEFDLETIERSALENVYLDFDFAIHSPCLIHGLAGWFDVHFDGSDESVWFSTSPSSAPTHWFQIRFLFKRPLAVNAGQRVRGVVEMNGTSQQSYKVHAIASIVGTGFVVETAQMDLKDPDYRYYSAPATSYCPPSAGAGSY